MRSEGMRGQAFVVFTDMVTAANAMREAQNNQFFNKVCNAPKLLQNLLCLWLTL